MISIRYNAVNYFIYSVFLIFILINFYFVDNVNPQKLDQVKVKLNDVSISDLKSDNKIFNNKYIEIDTLINVKKINKVEYKKNISKKVQKKSNTIKKNYFLENKLKNKNNKKKQPTKINIENIKYSNKKTKIDNQFLKSPLKLSKQINNNKNIFKLNKETINSESALTKKDLIRKGESFLKNNENISFSFKWPLDLKSHDEIYLNLINCLGVKGIILDKNQDIFTLNKIYKNGIPSSFSSILRQPSNIYSNLEKNYIKDIRIKYDLIDDSNYFRMFPKELDYFIFGKVLKTSEKLNIQIKNFSGTYKVVNSNIYINNLMINNKFVDLDINLSKFCN
tara:strand:+ start:2348 stop:3355 length:1008 start_codon:yes stop_codon:yes gene_type:complete